MAHIRKLRRDDIAAACAIVAKNYSPHYAALARRELEAMFTGSSVVRPTYFAVVEKGRLLGFAGYIVSWMDYSVGNVFWVNVDPAFQRRGIGKMLLEKIIAHARTNPDMDVLLLTAKIPEYYRRNFGFRTLSQFGETQDHLMELQLAR
jgi:ribosomal protein S18 acetylase RimI-like enzyme